MTTQQARLQAAETAFDEGTQPTFSIEKEPFQKWYVETNTDLPIYLPFTKEAHKYFNIPSLRDIKGIEQDTDTGNYVVTTFSTMSEDDLYRALRFIALS